MGYASSNGPQDMTLFPSPEEGNGSSIRNVFCSIPDDAGAVSDQQRLELSFPPQFLPGWTQPVSAAHCVEQVTVSQRPGVGIRGVGASARPHSNCPSDEASTNQQTDSSDLVIAPLRPNALFYCRTVQCRKVSAFAPSFVTAVSGPASM
jgi:hypothetical protein